MNEAAIFRDLQHRALPPARFRRPIPLPRRAQVLRPAAPPGSRRGLSLFAATLALTSLTLAGWNLYWLAAPLRAAVASLFA
jgi:hypothetical protein